MDTPSQLTSSSAAAPYHVSLIRGGPFYRFQRLLRLISPDHWNLGGRITLAIAVGWLPLVLITAILNPSALDDLLRDYRVTARMLIAVPVLLIGQVVMESRFRTIVSHLRDAEILEPPQLSKLDAIISNLMRWRDAPWPELILIGLVYLNISIALTPHVGESRPWALSGDGLSHLLPAGWYYAFVSQLIYQFLVALSAWKWLLWSYFAMKLSRLDMDLVATHPDQHGGIGFLGLSPVSSAPVAFAVAVAIGGNWREQILNHGKHVLDFKIDAIVLYAIVAIIAVGPLIFFMPRLAKLRKEALLQYGTLGQMHSLDFHKKWVLNPNRNPQEFLTAPEIGSLAAYGTCYDDIVKMQPFPVGKAAFLVLALAVLLPLLPVAMTEIPLAEILKSLLEAAK